MHEVSTLFLIFFLQILSLFARLCHKKWAKRTPKQSCVDECEANVLKQLEQLSVENVLLSNKDNSLIFPS